MNRIASPAKSGKKRASKTCLVALAVAAGDRGVLHSAAGHCFVMHGLMGQQGKAKAGIPPYVWLSY
jgi:hypothetical protein